MKNGKLMDYLINNSSNPQLTEICKHLLCSSL